MNVTIPVYTIQCHGLSIPLSLRYNTSGIRVFDDPYPCGYGWDLLPGLRVMRTILGRPDELFEYKGGGQYNLGDDYTTTQRCMTTGKLVQGVGAADKYDSEHDIFTVSLTDGNYTFILEKDNQANVSFRGVGNSEIKVTADRNLQQILVTDANGIKYYFGKNLEISDFSYVLAWMIDKIELVNGEIIIFEWKSDIHTSGIGVLSPESYADNLASNTESVYNGKNLSPNYMGTRMYITPFKLYQNLKKIICPGGVTVDMEYAGYLKEIRVNDRATTVKTVKLFYQPVSSAGQSVLKALNISDDGNYVFNYNPRNFNNPYAQDYWGYYNGKPNPASLSPKLRRKFYNTPGYIQLGFADRSVDTLMMQANILTQVVYPTGGSTTFEYEPHHFNDPTSVFSSDIHPDDNKPITCGGGLRVRKVINNPGSGGKTVVKRYAYGPDENGLANCIATPLPQTFVSRYSVKDLDRSVIPPYIIEYDMVSVGPVSNYLDCNTSATPIWYSQVTEYIEADDTETGKIVYDFIDLYRNNDFRTDDYGNPYPLEMTKLFSDGISKASVRVYSKETTGFNLISGTYWTYNRLNIPHLITSTKIHRQYHSIFDNFDAPDFDEDGRAIVEYDSGDANFPTRQMSVWITNAYKAYPYNITLDKYHLKSETNIKYTKNGNSIIKKSFDYIDNCGIIKEVVTTVNDNTAETMRLYYANTAEGKQEELTDYTSQAALFSQMTANNILAAPVYTTLTRNGSTISAQNIFKHYGSRLYMPERTLSRRGNETATIGRYDYDTHGNLILRTLPTGVSESFMWGYSGRYPIAHIQGANFKEEYSALFSDYDLSEWPYQNNGALTEIKDLVGDEVPVSVYTYKESVGLSGSEDPVGLKYNYNYDSANRLSGISENVGIQTDEYAYELPGENLSATISSAKSEYEFGEPVGLTCNAVNGSAHLSYLWSLSSAEGFDPDLSDNTAKSVNAIIDGYGAITATCVVTDLLKGTQASANISFNQKPQTLSFSDITENNGNSTSATLYCGHNVTVRFRVMKSIDSDSFEILIYGHDYKWDISPSETIDVTLSKGTHYIELKFTDDDTPGEIILYMLSVTGSYGENCETSPILISR